MAPSGYSSPEQEEDVEAGYEESYGDDLNRAFCSDVISDDESDEGDAWTSEEEISKTVLPESSPEEDEVVVVKERLCRLN